MPANETSVVIIGGGIAGLSAAYALQRLAPAIDTVLLESEQRLGGKIYSDRVGGFVIEAGPDSFLASKPAGLTLCRQLGLAARLETTNAEWRRTYVLQGAHLYPMPEGLSGLVPSRLEPLLTSSLFSPEGKERLRREPEIPRAGPNGDETLASFVERRFGREVYERLIEPLMAGIYAGDGAQLSLQATFPQLRRLEEEYGSLLAGIQAQRDRAPAAARPGFLTPQTGMMEIVEALQRALRRLRFQTGTPVVDLRAGQAGYMVRREDGTVTPAPAVIVATPAPVTAQILAGLDPDLAALLDGIDTVSTAIISLAFRQEDVPHPLDGYGYIVPRVEQQPVLACTWSSRKFAHRAPEGYALLRAFVGRAGMTEVLERGDEELVALVREELATVLGITAAPVLSRVFRWPRAMPQYRLGHLELLARIEARLATHPGLFLAGNAYHGIGIPDCIRSGESAAQEALTYLATRRSPSAR